MEEEAQRVSQGQVPEPVPAAVLCKDSTPSSINAIFSPPINQFDYSSPTNLTYNPFEGQSPLGGTYMEQQMETEEAVAPLSLGLKQPGEPLEGREAPAVATGDADSQEAAGAQGAAFSHHEAPTPTAEEVDAALAELDSIPDGVCESGDVEEEEDDEEGWSYFHMEPQTRPQSEDVLVHGSSAGVVQSSENITEPIDQDIINVSSEDHFQLTEGELVDSVEQSTELFPELKDQSEDQFGNFVREQAQETPKDFTIDYPENEMNSQLMDSFQFQPKEQSSPMEADQPPVVANAPDFLQTSIEKPFDFDIRSDKATLMETSLDKIPDVMGSNVEPSSPHGSISPHVPGSPRSVEGYITSVELNTTEESFGQNFAINQSPDLLIGAVDQPSGAFSVYVSSSPEPASLDPSLQTPVDLGNALEGVTNGTLEGDFKVPEPDLSPVEIVHAQSTVEVVAPPLPVGIKEQEVQFIVPNPVSESPTSPQLFSDRGQSSDITFIPEPVVEPVAEVPVPVYIEGNTPVSEGEMEIHPDSLAEEPNVEEMGSEEEEIPEIAETVCELDTPFSPISQALDSSELSKDQVEPEADVDIKSPVEPEADVDIKSPVEPEVDVDIKSPVELAVDVDIKSPVEPEVDVDIKSPVEPEADVDIKSPVEPEADVEIKSPVELAVDVDIKSPVKPEADVEIKSPVEPEVDVAIKLPSLLSVDNEAKSQPDSETVNVDVNGTPADTGVGSVINDIVEDVLPAVEEKKLEMPKVDAVVTKASIKTDKTPVKGTPSKTSAKPTPGKVTPAKPTSKSTPTRTPSTKASPLTKTAERKSPVTKTLAAVPGKPAIEKSSSTKLAPTKPAQTKPATAKPMTTTTAAARPSSTKPIQRTATPRLSTTSSLSTKTEKKITPKPPTPTAPRASLSKPSASASKPAPARPTPTTRTITKRPVTAPSKSTDKPDSGKEAEGTIRKTTTRPTSAPRTTTTTTTSASRKVMPASARSAAEKETKNTTNRILSTAAAKPAPRPMPGMTKPPLSKTSTTAARSTLATNARTTTKVNGTSTTSKAKTTTMVKSSATKSSGVATKRTMVSKTKTTTTGEKVVSEKTDKAEVIGAIQPVVNGENKIADEETSVEVIEKCAVEDIMQASTEKVFTQSSLTMTTSEQVVTTTDTTEVIVNGDH